MRKHKWAIIAGVCVVALLAAAGVIYSPLLFRSRPPAVSKGHVVLMPAHWWKMEMTEQQFGSLRAVWGQDVSAAQLLQELWPDVLQQMPQEVATGYEKRRIFWPTETYEEWEGQMICNGTSVFDDEGPITCCIYLGTHESEEGTFEIAGDRGFAEERTYRVSLYTGIRLEGWNRP